MVTFFTWQSYRVVVPLIIQNEDEKDSEKMASHFLEILQCPLHDVELQRLAAGDWLTLCEEMLRKAMELLEPCTPSGLVKAIAEASPNCRWTQGYNMGKN